MVCLAIANEETENLMDAAAFARMKPDAFFINMSRGNLVDEAALAKALTEGRIAGAAMDVGRAPDQMPSPELARLPNVIATPHIGGLTPPASESQAFDTVRQVEALVKGEVPPGAANLESWTRRKLPPLRGVLEGEVSPSYGDGGVMGISAGPLMPLRERKTPIDLPSFAGRGSHDFG